MPSDHLSAESPLRTAMDALYRLCVIVAGGALVLISAVIPWGVFTRYVLNSAASWPEPMAILLTIVMTFFGAAACYRAGTHMSVSVVVRALSPPLRRGVEFLSEGLVALVGLFMVIWGARLVGTTWHQSIAEFPALSVGVTYLPIPIAGGITLVFCRRAHADWSPATCRRGRWRRPDARLTPTKGLPNGNPGRRRDPSRLLCSRRADRLRARARRTRRRLLDRYSARGGNAPGVERRQQIRDADDPVLCAGRCNHGRRRHGPPAGGVRQCAGRTGADPWRAVGRQRPRHDILERNFRLGCGRHFGDRVGYDPADGKDRLSARLRHECHDQRVRSGAACPTEPQCRHLFARHRRRDFNHQPVHGRGDARPVARRFAHPVVPGARLSQRPSTRRERAVARGCKGRRRCPLGARDIGDHPRRELGGVF